MCILQKYFKSDAIRVRRNKKKDMTRRKVDGI